LNAGWLSLIPFEYYITVKTK